MRYPNSPLLKPPPSTVHPQSDAIVGRIRAQGKFTTLKFGHWRTAADFTHPLYVASSTDPLYTLRGGYGNPWKNPDVEGKQIRCPSRALPAGGSDGSLAILQQDGTEVDLWLAQKPGQTQPGELRFGFGKLGRWDGDGLEHGAQGGITAAGFQNGLGVIRLGELKAGRIPHALFIAVHGWKGRCYPGVLKANVMQQDPTNGVPPMMGQPFRLNYAASEIDALKRPPWQTTILKAMAEFGMYVGDQSGSVIALQPQSDDEFVAAGKPPAWVEFCKTAPGVTSFHQLLVNVDTGKTEDRTIYQLDWTLGVDWSRLQALNPAQ